MERQTKKLLPFEKAIIEKELESYDERQQRITEENRIAFDQEDWHDNPAAEAAERDAAVLADMASRTMNRAIGALVIEYSEMDREIADLGSIIGVRDEDDESVGEYFLTGNTIGEIPEEVIVRNPDLEGVFAITINSPLGKAIYHKSVFDKVTYSLPSGEVKTVIIETIDYPDLR
jgi:transcription elongation GreA/GreB family factor